MIQFLIDIPGNGVRARAIVRDITPGKGMGVGIVARSQEDRARYFTFRNRLQSLNRILQTLATLPNFSPNLFDFKKFRPTKQEFVTPRGAVLAGILFMLNARPMLAH